MSITFIISIYYAFNTIKKNNPTILKEASPKTTRTGDNYYYYEWNMNLIRNICLGAIAFTFGVEAVFNLIVFLIIGKWFIPSEAAVLIIFIYGFFIVEKFMKFVSGII